MLVFIACAGKERFVTLASEFADKSVLSFIDDVGVSSEDGDFRLCASFALEYRH